MASLLQTRPDSAELDPAGRARTLLSVRGLEVDFVLPSAVVRAVRGVDLEVAPGEVLALVGESGSGKSVTAASILGLLPRGARVSGGSITFQGKNLVGLRDRELDTFRGNGIGMIFQNPVTSLDPSFTVGSQLNETARLHLGASRQEATEVSAAWLAQVGLRDAARVLRSYPHELSGGMRQRVMIALASLAGPTLLIADEPTTALDATVQKQILDLLLGLTSRAGTAVLLITHDFGVVAHASDRVAVMQRGAVVETGETARVLTAPEHPYTRLLIESVPRIGRRHVEGGAERRLLGGAAKSVRDADARRTPASAAEPIVRLDGVSRDFVVGGLGTGHHAARVRAVNDVSFEVRRGEVVGLIGESGSGKSTLARLATGLLPTTTGRVTFDGRDVAALDAAGRRELRRRFQYVFQDAATALNPRLTVRDQITRPLVRLGRAGGRRAAREQTTKALDLVGLSAAYGDRYPRELSGGERQRVGIARAVALEPDVLILDEPTSALDVSTQATILNLLLDLKAELGLTYLFIGHNLAVIEFLCDRIGVLQHGALVETFAADDLFSPERAPATRALLDAVLPISPPDRHASTTSLPVTIRTKDRS